MFILWNEAIKYNTEEDTTAEDNTTPPPAPVAADADAEGKISLFQISELWNEILTLLGFPRILKNTPAREKSFKARVKTSSERKNLDWWQKLFERIALSDFLRSKNWFRLDWLLNENNLVKLLEGKYDNRENSNDRPIRTFDEILASCRNTEPTIDAEYSIIRGLVLMTENDRKAFYDILDIADDLTILPAGKDLEHTKKALFFSLMEYHLVIEAVKTHCKANKFFPMLADIAALIEGKIEERATVAWYQILKARLKYGVSKGIRFSTPATHFAIDRMCGWPKLCDMITDSNASYMLKDFNVFYRLGEKLAAWNNVCEYFPSSDERYDLSMGRLPKRKVYDVETGRVIPYSMLSSIAPIAAWTLVMRERRKKCVKFPDPAIHYAIAQMGGWEEFCFTLNEDTQTKKLEEFRRCYLNYNSSTEIPAYLSSGANEGDVFDVESDRYIRK